MVRGEREAIIQAASERSALNWPMELEWIGGTEVWTEQNILFPFALDELICRRLGRGGRAAFHVWRHPSALVLGLRDRRLPHAEAAMAAMRRQGRAVGVRNSGGAVVPLDAGVANLSLLLPISERSRDFRDDFMYMVRLIEGATRSWTEGVRAGEIEGAYCPGEYDLSLNGRKFCGISQRRQAQGFAVQAFVNVEGAGDERSRTAAEFYRLAGGDPAEERAYPAVEPGRTCSLAEMTNAAHSPDVTAFGESVRGTLQGMGIRLIKTGLTKAELAETFDIAERLRTRYDR